MVGQWVEVQVLFVLDTALSSITRHGSLIVATSIRNLATTAAVAWPFTIALQGLVLARILHLEILPSLGTASAPRRAVGIERQSGDGVWRGPKRIRIDGAHRQGFAGLGKGKLTFCLRR